MEREMSSVSVIIPVFNEEKNITPLYQEVKSVLDDLGRNYEIIFVDDGSVDKSPEILNELANRDRSLKVVVLSRNFGQTAALVSGVDCARGEVIIFMDGDLQNDPKDIPLLISKIQEGYDVVSGWRKRRKDFFLTRRLPSLLANKLISFLSKVTLHDYGCTLKAYRSTFLKDIRLYGEMHRFIPIYASWAGARITEVVVSHRQRVHGRTKYNLFRIVKVMLDLTTIKFLETYETKPIYIFGGSGIISVFLSLVCLIMLIYNKFVHGISMIQSPLLLLSAILIVIGIQVTLIGLLAELQIRNYFESLNKSTYIIKNKLNL